MKSIRAWLIYSVGLLIVVLMFWDLIFSEHGYFVFQQESERTEQLQTEIQHLQQEKARLNAEVLRLRDDPRSLEEVIHRELGYVYPDEYMLIMPKKTQNNVDTQELDKQDRSEDE